MNNKILNIEKRCAICEKEVLIDSANPNFDCPFCGWYNNRLGEENENSVIFPNLISLNKAKLYYKEGKAFIPDLNDFLEMFDLYSEVGFDYKGLSCQLFKTQVKDEIEFGWSPESIQYFKNKEDFVQNAKIGNEYVRDIWDKVEDSRYI